MTEEETYIENVFTRLQRNHNIEPNDIESVKQTIAECFFFGFTERNAVRLSQCIEEVDPELPEETALRRMKIIREEATTKNHRYKKGPVLPHHIKC